MWIGNAAASSVGISAGTEHIAARAALWRGSRRARFRPRRTKLDLKPTRPPAPISAATAKTMKVTMSYVLRGGAAIRLEGAGSPSESCIRASRRNGASAVGGSACRNSSMATWATTVTAAARRRG